MQAEALGGARLAADHHAAEHPGVRRIGRELRAGHARHRRTLGGIDDHLGADRLAPGAVGHDDAGRPAVGDAFLFGMRAAVAAHQRLPLLVDVGLEPFQPGGLDREKLAEIIGDGVKRFGWRLVVLDYLGLPQPTWMSGQN